MQYEVHERFVLLLADVLDKRLRRELFAQFVGGQPVLGEPVVELFDDWKKRGGVRRRVHRNDMSRRTWAAVDGQLF